MKTSLLIMHVIIVLGFLAMILFVVATSGPIDINFYIILVILSVYTFLFGFATGKNLVLSSKKMVLDIEDFEKTRLEIIKKEKFMEAKVKSIMQNFKEIINALEEKVKNRTIELQRVLLSIEQHRLESKQKEVRISALQKEIEKLKKKSKKRA